MILRNNLSNRLLFGNKIVLCRRVEGLDIVKTTGDQLNQQ